MSWTRRFARGGTPGGRAAALRALPPAPHARRARTAARRRCAPRAATLLGRAAPCVAGPAAAAAALRPAVQRALGRARALLCIARACRTLR